MGLESDLTLEKMRIHERLATLEAVSKEGNEKLKNIESLMMSQITENRRIMFGNGGVGIVTRVDRIEQDEKKRRWVIGAIILTLIGIIGDWIKNLFSGR